MLEEGLRWMKGWSEGKVDAGKEFLGCASSYLQGLYSQGLQGPQGPVNYIFFLFHSIVM